MYLTGGAAYAAEKNAIVAIPVNLTLSLQWVSCIPPRFRGKINFYLKFYTLSTENTFYYAELLQPMEDADMSICRDVTKPDTPKALCGAPLLVYMCIFFLLFFNIFKIRIMSEFFVFSFKISIYKFSI